MCSHYLPTGMTSELCTILTTMSNCFIYCAFPDARLPVLIQTAVLFAQMRVEKDRYVICLDVKHFSPDELSVSISEEFITIHARHQDRQVRAPAGSCTFNPHYTRSTFLRRLCPQDDHGFVSREFLRKYKLPAGVTAANVSSSLSIDGVLTITVPRPSLSTERTIPISCEDGTAKQKM